MKTASAELPRFKPTVFGAVRRYRVMVAVVVIAAVAAALGLYGPGRQVLPCRVERLGAAAPVAADAENAAQYLDSQVLLMQSQGVAQAGGAHRRWVAGPQGPDARQLPGPGQLADDHPAVRGRPGTYGASVVQVSFESSSARTAQAGADAFIEAFDQARSADITAQANADIAGINQAISAAGSQSQRTALVNQRTQEIINEKSDLASRPTAVWAIKPAAPASGSRAQSAVIGLVAGLVAGAALAYARASRGRGFRSRQDPRPSTVCRSW